MFDGAVIILSLAPMVASTVANGPSSPWDAISLIITLRIWRVKRIIDGEWELCLWLQALLDRLGKRGFKVQKDWLLPLFLSLFFLLLFANTEQKRVMTPMEESRFGDHGCISWSLGAFIIQWFVFLLATFPSCKVNALTCFMCLGTRCHSRFWKIIDSSLLCWYLLHPPHNHTASSVLGLHFLSFYQ